MDQHGGVCEATTGYRGEASLRMAAEQGQMGRSARVQGSNAGGTGRDCENSECGESRQKILNLLIRRRGTSQQVGATLRSAHHSTQMQAAFSVTGAISVFVVGDNWVSWRRTISALGLKEA